ncbi:hypothetical protein B0J13DRAFT_560913 [Dactylonectria estremocensis]|uniref:Uncharacterized protein n=1 Tax=Dactylonectria estremocensis TaxID=1079267 RepID=A0A9P9EC17_9HYPO|nr:hypothetical protein B0J13DRAFT_560913 [Dactylonectria estremocensis]
MMSNCLRWATLDDFDTYVNDLRDEWQFKESGMRDCRADICTAIYGTGNPDISGIGVAVGYVLDLALGIFLSLAVIFLKPVYERKDPAHKAYQIFVAGLAAFFDAAAYFAFALQLAAIAVLVRKDYGISTVDMGALETEIAQAVAVLSLLPLLYPVVLLEGGRDGVARHNARLLLLSLTVAMSFYPFMSRCFHAFGESPIGSGKGDVVSSSDWHNVEDMCFPSGVGGLLGFMNSTTYKALDGLELATSLIIYLFTFWTLASLPASRYPYKTRKGETRSRRLLVNDWFGCHPFAAALPLFVALGLVVPLLWVIFHLRILQKDLAESMGEKYVGGTWGFGQIVSLVLFLPVVVTMAYRWSFGDEWDRREW